jgi:hypothetical protein
MHPERRPRATFPEAGTVITEMNFLKGRTWPTQGEHPAASAMIATTNDHLSRARDEVGLRTGRHSPHPVHRKLAAAPGSLMTPAVADRLRAALPLAPQDQHLGSSLVWPRGMGTTERMVPIRRGGIVTRVGARVMRPQRFYDHEGLTSQPMPPISTTTHRTYIRRLARTNPAPRHMPTRTKSVCTRLYLDTAAALLIVPA